MSENNKTTWTSWIAISVAALATMAGCVYAGFLAGQRIATAEALEQQVTLQNQNSELQAQLAIARLPPKSPTTAQQPHNNIAHAEVIDMPPDPDDIPPATPAQLEVIQGGNCGVIKQQIKQIQKELQGSGSAIVYDANETWQTEQKNRKEALSLRLVNYQQRLDYCSE